MRAFGISRRVSCEMMPLRLDDTTLAALDERAARDHITRSEAIRAAIRAYVA